MNHSKKTLSVARPQHGGSLHAMSTRFDVPLEDWLDLSTGVNPFAYSVTKVPASAWASLPDEDQLDDIAKAYYQCESLLMVPGSQWAISNLPHIFQDLTEGVHGKILVPAQGYREHAYAWLDAGYELAFYHQEPSEAQLQDCDVCVVINPNNPTGHQFTREQLEAIYDDCRAYGTLLVVDEAFVDLQPEHSMLSRVGEPDLIVLRSLGKFFGLAGVRVGAICAWQPMLTAISSYLPPWAIPGPSRYAAGQAMADAEWITKTRDKLTKQEAKLIKVLKATFDCDSHGTRLFQTIYLSPAQQGGARFWYEQLAQRGIAVRLLDEADGLRFGMPGAPKAWKRFEAALAEIKDYLPSYLAALPSEPEPAEDAAAEEAPLSPDTEASVNQAHAGSSESDDKQTEPSDDAANKSQRRKRKPRTRKPRPQEAVSEIAIDSESPSEHEREQGQANLAEQASQEPIAEKSEEKSEEGRARSKSKRTRRGRRRSSKPRDAKPSDTNPDASAPSESMASIEADSLAVAAEALAPSESGSDSNSPEKPVRKRSTRSRRRKPKAPEQGAVEQAQASLALDD